MGTIPMHIVRRPRLHRPTGDYAARSARQRRAWANTLRRLPRVHPSGFTDVRGACCGK